MADAVQVVRDFCAAWEARDQQRILDAFTDDGVYHNMPMTPAVGKAAIRGLLQMVLTPAQSVTFEIGGKTVELPVMGTFEVREGKIAAWRDYFDLATWTKQASA